MSVRRTLLRIHRWCGIALAGFLVLAGVTGAFLAFHHEIEAALVPELHRVAPGAGRASLDEAAARLETRHPELVVGYFLFTPDERAAIRVIMNTREAANDGRLDRDSPKPSEIFLDPYTGAILGERNWGEVGATRAHVVPMVYRLHMSLFLGEPGRWITAGVAAVWIVMLFLGAVLAVPRLRHLGSALSVKWGAGRARAFFDLHRTAGLASIAVLVVIAFTGLYMNIPAVVEPALAAVAPFTERPPSVRPKGEPREAVWRVGWDAAYARARAGHADDPVAGIGRVEARGYYQVRFLPPGDIMDSGTIRYFVDGRDGRLIGRFDHREGTVGDKIRTWQFPLHSGQGFGLAGRILVCVAGLVPPLLAFTGLWLWLRRTRLRRRARAVRALTAPAT